MAKRVAKGGGKVVLRPVLRYFDRMFASLGERVDLRARESRASVEQGVALLEAALADVRRVGEDLHIDAATLHELGLLAGLPTAPASHTASPDRTAPGSTSVEIEVTKRTAPGQVVAVGDSVASLDQDTADLVNWVISPIGMAGEALAWINHGASMSFGEGRAWIDNLNERIVELPWAHAQASRLDPGSLLLDIGSTEGLLAVELATWGHQVLALDPRPYPLEHPNVEAIASTVEAWGGPPRPLDAVFAISAIEHFGLGHYVERADREDLDQLAMERFAAWLHPGAPLFLTVPFGTWQVSELERVYDTAHLEQLIKGWDVVERNVFARRSSTEWQRLDPSCIDEDWSGDAGVVLLELRQPT